MSAAGFPDGIEAHHANKRHRMSAAVLPILLLGAIMAAALLGLFGGSGPTTQRRETADATLSVKVPTTLRSGLFFEMSVAVEARRDLADTTIAITPQLWRDMTINTTIPEPASEEFADGAFRLHYGKLAAGDRLETKFDGQINPDLFIGTDGKVTLYDGDRRVADIPMHITVLP